MTGPHRGSSVNRAAHRTEAADAHLPTPPVYWAHVPAAEAGERRRAPQPRGLLAAIEPMIPAPLSTLHISTALQQDRSVLALAFERSPVEASISRASAEQIASLRAALRAAPEQIRAIMPAPVLPDPLRGLETPAVRVRRSRALALLVIATLATAAALLAGTRRHADAWNQRRSDARSSTQDLLSRALGPELARSERADIALLSWSRSPSNAEPAAPTPRAQSTLDAGRTLAELLERWPRPAGATLESISIDRLRIEVRALTADHRAAADLADGLAPVAPQGWTALPARSIAQRTGVAVHIAFQPAAQASNSLPSASGTTPASEPRP